MVRLERTVYVSARTVYVSSQALKLVPDDPSTVLAPGNSQKADPRRRSRYTRQVPAIGEHIVPASEAAMENLEQRMARPIGPLPKSPVVVENNLCRRCAALALKMTSGSGINYPSEPKGQQWRNRLMFADMSSGNETNWQSFAYGQKRWDSQKKYLGQNEHGHTCRCVYFTNL